MWSNVTDSMPVRAAIALLCAAGLYVSLFMVRKTRRAERGEIDGPSVVNEPHARLFFGVPNALVGSFYYPLLALAVWIYPSVGAARFGPGQVLEWFVLLAVAAAAATSCFLAFNLLFLTKRECAYCWASHALNGVLLVIVTASFFS